MKKKISIANGQGFWGDSIDAPINLVRNGSIDYLTLDYLAEVTLSIMQRQKLKNSKFGYADELNYYVIFLTCLLSLNIGYKIK